MVEVKTFLITFSCDEWKSIAPQSKIYHGKKRPRVYETLAPFEWSNVVQEHFYIHTKLPCAITFKNSKVSSCGYNYVTIHGKCTECESMFYGEIKNIPAMNNR